MDLVEGRSQPHRSYTKNVPAKPRYPAGNVKHFLLARRLVEVGVPVVHFNLGYWDWHGENFVAGRQQIPMLDAGLSTLIEDLDARGLLDSTIVLALGEMGRHPKCGTDKNAGRDHWDYAQFVFAAGGGFRGGNIVGATDKTGAQVTDKFYKIESFGRTLYHLLGIDPDTVVRTPANRPVKLIAEDYADHKGSDYVSWIYVSVKRKTNMGTRQRLAAHTTTRPCLSSDPRFPPMSMPFDATLKDLGRDAPADFLTTFGRSPVEPLTLLNVDLSTVTTSADLIIGVGDPLVEVIHIDFQSSAAAWKHADVTCLQRLAFQFNIASRVHSTCSPAAVPRATALESQWRGELCRAFGAR